MEAQLDYIHVAYMFAHVWRRFVCSVGVSNNISAAELSRKFIKSPLLVGYFCYQDVTVLDWIISNLATLTSCYCEIHCLCLRLHGRGR